MVTELGLSGKALLLYALIHGFSQDKSGGYSGVQDYLMQWLRCSRTALYRYIQELKKQGILQELVTENGQQILRTTRQPCSKMKHDVSKTNTPCSKMKHEDVSKTNMPCFKNEHPTIYNNTDNTIYNYSCSRGPETPTPPTTPPKVEEVEAYCRERGNDIDAGRFVDYYAVSGWKLRGKPIEDWRALIRLWEQNGRANKAAPVTETSAAGNGTNGEAAKNSFDTDDFWAAALKKSYGG